MKRTAKANDLCMKWEGYGKELPNGDCKAYPDPGPTRLPWTIGFGTTYYSKGTEAAAKYGERAVEEGDVLTRAEAEECFSIVMDERENLVNERIEAPLTQAMFDALVSFYYNLYPGAYPQQINRCNAGLYEECAASFDKYIYAGGVVLQGLINRRNDEEALFRSEGLNPPRSTTGGTSSPVHGEVENGPDFDLYPYRPLSLPWQREDDYLTIGDKNDDVLELRCALIGLGLLPRETLVSDLFDEELKTSVFKFQKLAGLKEDGIVGDITASEIENRLARARTPGTSRILTAATYYYQYNNKYEPGSTCGNTSAAMLLSMHGVAVTPDELYERFGKNQGQSPEGLAALYRDFGLKSISSRAGTFAEIREAIDENSPVVIHGYFTKSGHIVCVVGYDRFGLVVNDPAGAWNGVPRGGYANASSNGRNRPYSYDLLPPIEINDGNIWLSRVVP